MDRLNHWPSRQENTAATMAQRCKFFTHWPLSYSQQAAFTISWCSASDSVLCHTASKQRLPSAGVQLQTASSVLQPASSVYHQLVFSFRQRPLSYSQPAVITISWYSGQVPSLCCKICQTQRTTTDGRTIHSQHNTSVALHWGPAHCGVPGNGVA